MDEWHYLHQLFPHREQLMLRISLGPATSAPKQMPKQGMGKGLEGKGRGSDKGPITVPLDVPGALRWPSATPGTNKLRFTA